MVVERSSHLLQAYDSKFRIYLILKYIKNQRKGKKVISLVITHEPSQERKENEKITTKFVTRIKFKYKYNYY